MDRISLLLVLVLVTTACSKKSSDGLTDADYPSIKTPPSINVSAKWAKLERIRWTTPYPSTCVRDPEKRGKIIRARKLKPDPKSIDLLGLKLPERARIIDACEVEISRGKLGRVVQQRYMVDSDEWVGPVAYFMSIGLEHDMYFEDFDQCDFGCMQRPLIPRGVSHYKEGQLQPNCLRTDFNLSVEQPPNSKMGEIVFYKSARFHRGSGVMDANGCSG
jgi:hypothetical protein